MFVVVFMIAIHVNIKAQLNVGGTPYSWNNDFVYKKEVKATSFPTPDLKKLAEEDKKDEESGIPPRFGFLHSTNINLCSGDNVVYDTKEVTIY